MTVISAIEDGAESACTCSLRYEAPIILWAVGGVIVRDAVLVQKVGVPVNR